MTKINIKETIETYMAGTASDEVRMTFEKWITDEQSADEKDDALTAIWNDIPLTSASAPGDPLSIIQEAEIIENINNQKHTQNRTVWLWLTSAIAACMTVFAIIGWGRPEHSEMCLMSSESGKGRFSLPDGSIVWLNKDSKLYYSDNLEGDFRKVTLEGEGYFDVSKDPDRPFIVSVGDMSIKVLGTRFTVSAYDDRAIETYLEEGSILAEVPEHDPVILLPDQAAVYDIADKKFSVYTETASDHTAWIDTKLEFVNKSLNDILECLEHWYCVTISCNDTEAASQIHLSMTIRQESLDEICSALSRIANLSYFIDSRGNVKISFNR